jgi:polyphosphate kinase
VEAVAEVTDPNVQARLEEILKVELADDTLAWQLGPAGWTKIRTREGLDGQRRLQQLAEARSATPGLPQAP